MTYRAHVQRLPSISQSRTMKLSPALTELLTQGSTRNLHGNTAKRVGQYYNFPPPPLDPPSIAIISLGGSYRMSDLQAYWRLQGITETPSITHVTVGRATNRPEQPFLHKDGSEENTLDLEIATSLCPTAKFLIYFGTNDYDGFYQAVKAAVEGPARIISISWGGPENTFNGRVGSDAFEKVLQQAAEKGKVVLAATGDKGSNNNTRGLITDYPSCSPSVIACGGTTLLPTGQEVGWSWNPRLQWGSGGGVSSYFPTPSYQKELGYTGRATPDLSLLADPETGWSIYYQGRLDVNTWGGTSAVAPAMAALLACYNLPSYSNLHVKLYQTPSVFRDILTGTNDNLTGTKKSYSAKKGHDLVTGWGSVNGTQLQQVLR